MRNTQARWLLAPLLLATACRVSDPAQERVLPLVELAPASPALQFLVVGDMGTGEPDQYRVAEAMAKRAGEAPVEFVLTVGDNFYPKGVDSIDDPQWLSKFERVYAGSGLTVPFYVTLGNHDHKGEVSAQIEYGQAHPERWILPAPYYTFARELPDGTQIEFFVIDTTPLGHPGSEFQLEWLEQALTNSTANWKIVSGHHPLYSDCRKRPYMDGDLLISLLEPIFVKHQVDLYLAGHDHILQLLHPIRGVSYAISGAGGGPEKAYAAEWTQRALYVATLGGFLSVRASRQELLLEFIRLDGETEFAHKIQKPE